MFFCAVLPKIIIFDLIKYINKQPDVIKTVSANELQDIIAKIRKQTYPIGQAKGKDPMKYVTSSLEQFLSTTKCIYPGDADIVLLNNSYKAIALIEVKKHNKRSERLCSFKNESIDLYKGTDILKYKSLALLKEHLDCPMYMLFYSTCNSTINEAQTVKFERVVGNADKLTPVYPDAFPLPEINNELSILKFCKTFLDYHNNKCKYDFDKIILTDSYDSGKRISEARERCLQYIASPKNSAPERDAVKAYLDFVKTPRKEPDTNK